MLLFGHSTKKSVAQYLIATRTRTKVSVRDVQLFHAEGAVEIFFVRHHDDNAEDCSGGLKW